MQKNIAKIKLKNAAIIFALFLMCLALPLTMVYISFQSSDEIVLADEEPLNKKQGLPVKPNNDQNNWY